MRTIAEFIAQQRHPQGIEILRDIMIGSLDDSSVRGTNDTISNRGTNGSTLFAPFIIVDANPDTVDFKQSEGLGGGFFLLNPAGNTNGEGNSSSIDLGLFGIEDLFGLGDADYDDVIVQFDIVVVGSVSENTDVKKHFQSFGDNCSSSATIVGGEDKGLFPIETKLVLANGGDRDFNDFVFQVDFILGSLTSDDLNADPLTGAGRGEWILGDCTIDKLSNSAGDGFIDSLGGATIKHNDGQIGDDHIAICGLQFFGLQTPDASEKVPFGDDRSTILAIVGRIPIFADASSVPTV